MTNFMTIADAKKRINLENDRIKAQKMSDREALNGQYTVAELRAAWSLVENLDHWKEPVDAWVHSSMIGVVLDAIEFITGTKGTIAEVGENGRIRVTAIGYRRGPCN